jgi:hypothetical protein
MLPLNIPLILSSACRAIATGSIAILDRKGDKQQPCPVPLWRGNIVGANRSTGDEYKILIQERIDGPNPNLSSTINRYPYSAFSVSREMTISGCRVERAGYRTLNIIERLPT